MTDKAISTAPHGVFEHLVRSVTEKPLKELKDRVSERKRTKSGLERLLRAIERTPAVVPKRRKKHLS
ncbi:hypothetical protein [Comamonas kerstersii]|uniref:hypothetical protein n=1 Tax=Comamonas kerstersii TaxID=225992 RepID=UPI003A8E8704